MAASSSPEAQLLGARVLVTGGHGFLGRRLREALTSAGVRHVEAPTSGELDLLDRRHVRAWLADNKPDLVFHLAARVGGIGRNLRQPAAIFHDNLVMGVQLLDECHRAGVAKVVAVGTVCAYPKDTPLPFKEQDLWDGYPEETNAPYGLAKKMLLVQAQAYRAQYGSDFVVLLPANLYGPGDNFDLETGHVVPAIIRKLDEARRAGAGTVTLWGDGTPTREFLFVDDCARALLLAAARYDKPEPLNVGSGEEIAVSDLADRLARMMGWGGRFIWDASRPNGQPRRRLDVSRARQEIGFTASTTLDQGLRHTVDWYEREGRR